MCLASCPRGDYYRRTKLASHGQVRYKTGVIKCSSPQASVRQSTLMTEAPSQTKQVAISTDIVEKVMLNGLSARAKSQNINSLDQTSI